MAHPKILFAGATGYLGGTVFAALQASSNPLIKRQPIVALVRGQEKANAIEKEYGVETILFQGLDDLEKVKEIASQYDIVINCSIGLHPPSAEAFILGLADAQQRTGRQTHYIHVSGTTSLAESDSADTKLIAEAITDTDDVTGAQKKLNEKSDYVLRKADLIVDETAARTGVQAYNIMPPAIIGVGQGLYNKIPIFNYSLLRCFKDAGQPQYLDQGLSSIGWSHVADVASLYEVLLGKLLASLDSDDSPPPPTGHYFTSTSSRNWKHFTTLAGKIGVRLGALKSADPVSLSLEQAVEAWKYMGGDAAMITKCYGSTANTVPLKGVELGWNPSREGVEDWEKEMETCWRAVLEGSSKTVAWNGETLDSS